MTQAIALTGLPTDATPDRAAGDAAPPRRSLRLGLQGKLLLAFASLLAAALGLAGYLYTDQSTKQVEAMVGAQATQTAHALALAGSAALWEGRAEELTEIARDLARPQNVVFVAFFDADRKPIAFAHRDPHVTRADFSALGGTVAGLMEARAVHTGAAGVYLEVCAPVKARVPAAPPADATPDAVGTTPVAAAAAADERVIGYVTVGISTAAEEARLRRVTGMVTVAGGAILLLSLPLAYTLVHRIFAPIRQLVDATNRLAAGQLDAQVAIDRKDAIGLLGRAFNAMAARLSHQQQALATANAGLADANGRLESVNRGLEDEVSRRTEQLAAANRRLEGEIAEKEDFLRAVSHDLNAPLRNISGMASMLLMKHRQSFDADVIHRLERIQKNVEAETDLISELLELSRIKTRRQTLEPVSVDAMIRDLAGMFENDLRTREIAVTLDTPLPMISCERARLRQVFQNLIDNAIKYMGDGPTREIHVGCLARRSEAEFYVRDTGLGIEPDDVAKVFHVFRRGKGAATRNIPGKGVGLASVKSIVETYNGTIWVESTPGVGTTFRFTINGRFVVGNGGAPLSPETKAA